MKPRTFILLIIVAIGAAASGWFFGRHSAQPTDGGQAPTTTASAAGRTIYTCSMHPQVRQDHPGTCPFCGMTLAPLNSVTSSDLPPGSVMLSTNRLNAIHVQTTAVRRAPLRRTLNVAGVIDDNDSRHRILSAYIDGRLDRLFVNFVGAEVQAGQPLATFYSPTLLAAEREYVALTRRTVTETAQARDEQKRLLAGARQRLIQLGLNESQIAALPAKPADEIHTELLSPISGTVVTRSVYEGAYVKEGEKLFEIADFSSMWFQFDAYERDLAWLQPGLTVEVTTPSLPGQVFRAPIAFIDPNLNSPTRTAKVRVELTNPIIQSNGPPHRLFLHRLYADGRVNVSLPDVTVVPRSAVLAPGRPFVFLDQGGGVFEQRQIRLGRSGDDDWEVLEGLREGEMVVTTGNLLIDAQAQLDNGGAGSTPASSSATNTQSKAAVRSALSLSQRSAATNLLVAVDEITRALAADNITNFNRTAPLVATAATNALALLTNSDWAPLVQSVVTNSALPSTTDLKDARREFYPLSTAMSELAGALRRDAGFTDLHVFQCPMARSSFPGAPAKARWIQRVTEVRNPYFGTDMLDCGTEVSP